LPAWPLREAKRVAGRDLATRDRSRDTIVVDTLLERTADLYLGIG
jgi:hypothetical protein